MFYEIRRYQVRPGRRDEWVRYMEDAVIPFQVDQIKVTRIVPTPNSVLQ